MRPGEGREHEPGQGEHVVSQARSGRCSLQCQDRPEERGIRGHLRQEERCEDQPRHGDGQRRDHVGRQPPSRHMARQEVRGDRRGGHDVGVQHVGVVQRGGDVAVAIHRRDQQGVELIHARNEHTVHPRQRGSRARDADREPLVEQLVGHHEPVGDPAGDRGERAAQCQPEHDQRKSDPKGSGEDEPSGRTRSFDELVDHRPLRTRGPGHPTGGARFRGAAGTHLASPSCRAGSERI